MVLNKLDSLELLLLFIVTSGSYALSLTTTKYMTSSTWQTSIKIFNLMKEKDNYKPKDNDILKLIRFVKEKEKESEKVIKPIKDNK